jgi:peptidoglycan/LPS O-acetylase OafA/YrhL
MLGVLSVILLRDAEWRARLTANRTALRVAIGVLAVGFVWFTRWHSAMYDPTTQRFGFTLLAFLYASVLVYALTNQAGILSQFLRLRGLAWLGGIAYAVYLFHEYFLEVAFALLRHRSPDIVGLADTFAMLAALAATLAFCRLSWVYFEKPLIDFGHRESYEFAAPASPAPDGSSEIAEERA